MELEMLLRKRHVPGVSPQTTTRRFLCKSGYSHEHTFCTHHSHVPQVLVMPSKYIQGPGALSHLGQYIKGLTKAKNPALLTTDGCTKRGYHSIVKESCTKSSLSLHTEIFGGNCSYKEIERVAQALKAAGSDLLIAQGGGSLIDCCKFVAHQLGIPLFVCPTLASTDAPCSALSIIYNDDHVYQGGEVYPNSPTVVVVDSSIIAASPPRTLVAGMGDALATYFEARTCYNNPQARTMVNARPTTTALALAKLSHDILFEAGPAALQNIFKNELSNELEKVIEANTLLSGLGFESGGLASAHAVAQALTAIPSIPQNFQHGEMVALGTLTHLCMQDKIEEAIKVAQFQARVGLPVIFSQVGLEVEDNEKTKPVIDSALNQWFCHNEEFQVTSTRISQAFHTVNKIGGDALKKYGDEPFLRLRNQ